MRRFFSSRNDRLLKGKICNFKLNEKVEAKFFDVNNITFQNRFNG
jgi:hypothetical protein